MILSQEEREYIQLFNDMIVALYADSDIESLLGMLGMGTI